jgi:iron complex transport system ATP-binding protein
VALVTHELNLAAEFADTVLLLHQGRVLRHGPPAEVFERELLEQVFETELDVFTDPESGRPRVVLRGLPAQAGADAEGGGAPEPKTR